MDGCLKESKGELRWVGTEHIPMWLMRSRCVCACLYVCAGVKHRESERMRVCVKERVRDDFLIIFLNDTSALHPGCVIVITVPLFWAPAHSQQQ